MNYYRIITRSIAFYKRSHAGVLAGTILTGMILTGAMLVGDSVKATLHKIALDRLGYAELAMAPLNRFFNMDLADRLNKDIQAETAAILRLKGTVLSQGEDRKQLNNVHVIGCNNNFWKLTDGFQPSLSPDDIAINLKLAQIMNVKKGDEISLRVEKPGILPRDAPLSARLENTAIRSRFTITEIVSDNHLGRFSLEANQVTPYNVFININRLQEMTDLSGKANLLLVGKSSSNTLSLEVVESAMAKIWAPSDFGLRFRQEKDLGLIQLESERIFIDSAVEKVFTPPATGVLTYMVNSIAANGKSTPYSFITAITPSTGPSASLVPADMKDNEIMVNRWLADQLELKTGQSLKISYFELLPSNHLQERNTEFIVSGILEMDKVLPEKILTPRFPGLTDVDTCADWNIGMPMNEEALKDKNNEDYWKLYGQTPKALVTLQAGRKLWGSRFGSVTALRFTGTETEELSRKTTTTLTPSDLGYFFQPVRQQALTAVSQAMDLGQLFMGMSFFLIISSLMLTSFLFGLTIQQRSHETGMMMALGFGPASLRNIMIAEGGIIAFTGAAAGSACALFYTRLLIWALGNCWQGAVAGSSIQFHAGWTSPVYGTLATFLCALTVMFFSLRKQLRLSAREQLAGGSDNSHGYSPKWKTLVIRLISNLALSAAIVIVVVSSRSGLEHSVNAFFGAGALLLLASLGFSRVWLDGLDRKAPQLSMLSVALRNAGRQKGRSLAVISLLACGSFMVFAVSSMKENITADADKRWSGTGGFEYFAESTLPIYADLNTEQGRKDYGLDSKLLSDVFDVLNIKVHDGDDSSCFNLNRAVTPRILGIDPATLSQMKAFVPEKADKPFWELLESNLPDGSVPAIVGDSDTAMWGLQKKADIQNGDVLIYRDEFGQQFKVKLIAMLPMRLSVLQGNILIANSQFTKHFPSESGYRMFLIDIKTGTGTGEIREYLSSKLERSGFDMSPTSSRLKEFYSVESAYLSMFLVLGGFGLLLGTVGMGTVVWRNAVERRSDFALLQSLGFSRKQIRSMIIMEHSALLAVGLAAGLVSSILAIAPQMLMPGTEIPYAVMAVLAISISICGLLFTAAAAEMAIRGPIIASLRNE